MVESVLPYAIVHTSRALAGSQFRRDHERESRAVVTGRGRDGADYGVSSRWSRGLRPYSLLKAVLSAKAVE